ncbi:probable replication factor C subunit 1 isoform X3 [Asparagus officinalis]|uniref:probable replication factor C subunit 1 isoform X3 n=1 Tax=Asparagus officinalis TaxID=4686 RepID=UPI00098DE3DB|nr:probable replication factor C subunit 1 isoform X3 [Asparagus officinalis]
MEILPSDPKGEELAVIEEDDLFYEEIEAPKFVDFTVPDRSKPDDKSWFCLRIGCDQQHEEVDPDALYRSFLMRVMAARSPNIKLQKSLNPQAPSSIKKCPRSAPAKSVKDRISKMSRITSIPDKMANDKLRNHPVSSLRSTPNNTKSKSQPSTSDKKALTTPRAKKWPSIHEPFRSVKPQKAPVEVSKIKSAAKALFLGTPKKYDEASKSSNCTACGLNILEVSCKKDEGTSSMSLKKPNEPREADINSISSDHSAVKPNTEENFPTTSVLIVKEDHSEEGPKENLVVVEALNEIHTQAGVKENVAESDDDKENNSNTSRNVKSSTTNSENGVQLETNENIPQKEIRAPSKKGQEHGSQAGKVKRTTILKPFRLRTDERGILKEANLEKKIQLEALKETTMGIFRHGDGKQNGKPTQEKKQKISPDKGQKAETNQTRKPRVRFVESRYAKSIPKCHKSENNKENEESQKKIVKTTTSSRQILKAKSVTAASKVQTSRLIGKGALAAKTQVEEKKTANATSSKGKRPLAISKVSICHRLDAPKSSRRRPEMTKP